jgi:hypothetical protein
MENERTAFDRQPSDCLFVEQDIEWHFDNRLDLSGVWSPIGDWLEACGDPWRHQKVAGENIAVGELAENLVRCLEAKFFVQFTQCCIEGRFAAVDCASWEADLAGVVS